MTTRLWLCTVFVFFVAFADSRAQSSLSAHLTSQELANGTPESSGKQPERSGKESALLRARIVQLEDRERRLTFANQIASCQSLQASQKGIEKQLDDLLKQARSQAEKDAGCPIDWTATPPVCLPSPEKASLKK